MRELNVIADYGDLCGECPVWEARTSNLYWTDCVGLKFHRYHLPSMQHELMAAGLGINGFRLNRPGGFTIVNNQGIWLWNGKVDPVLIADEVQGSKCQMNDCIADPMGRLISGSNFYDPHGNYEPGKLIRVDTDGIVTILDEGFDLSNGLGFSPDCQTLYFTDSVARRIYAYDYNVTSGAASNRRVLVRVPDTEGLPDGLAVDAQGFIWSAQWYGSCVVRYDAEGTVERRIKTPAKQTSSITFGGPDLTDIFITSASQPESMPIMPPGYDPDSGYFGGQVYQINLDISGVEPFMTEFAFPQNNNSSS
jgi:D-xylonolactonase